MNPLFLFGTQSTPLRKLLLMKIASGGGALVEYTVTGNPVTFETDVAKPLPSVLATWQPHQSGSGDPSPSNVRPVVGMDGVNVVHCGENLLDNSRIVDTNVGTDLTGDRKAVSFTKPGKYYVKALRTWNEAYLYARVKNADGTFGNILYVVANKTVQNKTVTLTEGQTLIMFNASTGVNGTVEKTIERFEGWGIVVSFEDMTEYAPYSGTSYSVAFPATGKNLLTGTPYCGVFFNVEPGTDFAKSTVHATYTESGNEITVTTDSNWYGCVFATGMLSPGTYNIHTETSEANCRFSAYVTDADLITKERKAITANNISVTLTESARIAVVITNSSSGSVVATNVQVESGSSYTSWEPYTRTCYGGTLDLTTGVLTAEYKLFNIKDTVKADWVYYANARGYYFTSDKYGMKSGNYYDDPACVCNQYPKVYSWANDGVKIGNNNFAIFFCGVVSDYATVDDWFEHIASADIEVTFPLATPQTFQLSPTQISALIGNNTMWADADSLSVTYLKKG